MGSSNQFGIILSIQKFGFGEFQIARIVSKLISENVKKWKLLFWPILVGQKLEFQMPATFIISIFYPKLVIPKCVLGVFLPPLKPILVWSRINRCRNIPISNSNFDLDHPVLPAEYGIAKIPWNCLAHSICIFGSYFWRLMYAHYFVKITAISDDALNMKLRISITI